MKSVKKAIKLHSVDDDECWKFIQKAFESKKKKNPKFSIRAFAKYLEMDHSLLAKYLKGETPLSQKSIFQCLEKLNAPKELLILSSKKIQKTLKFSEISDDEFEYISNWAHFAILELMTLSDFELNPKNVQKKIGLSLSESKECIERLEKLGFIEFNENKYVLKRANNTWYPTDKTNSAKIQSQLNLLKASQKSLQSDPLETRDHSSVILAVNKAELPKIKEVIKEARRQLTKIMQKNNNFDDVYCLQLSLFPLREKHK